MRKTVVFISLLVILSLTLAACSGLGPTEPTPEATFFPTGPSGEVVLPNQPSETPEPTQTPTAAVIIEATSAPTQAQTEPAPTKALATATKSGTATATARPTVESVIGFPPAGSSGLVGLAAMFGFRVVDITGAEIGTVADYVINTCEANIAYIVVDRPGGERILVPYQATLEKPNNGRVDVPGRELVIALDSAALKRVPTLNTENLDMRDAAWEQESLEFWRGEVAVSVTTGCQVPSGSQGEAPNTAAATATPTLDPAGTPAGTPSDGTATPTLAAGTQEPAPTAAGESQVVRRIVLASAVPGAALEVGNNVKLGTVRDVAIVPETGRTQFILVQPEGADHLVALPPGALTVRYAEGSEEPAFVLLVDSGAFQSAPVFDESLRNTDEAWFTYWQQFVPMTMEELQK